MQHDIDTTHSLVASRRLPKRKVAQMEQIMLAVLGTATVCIVWMTFAQLV